MEACDMKAMREALEDARNYLLKHCGSSEAHAIAIRIEAALDKPPRQCDVGTAEEQFARYYKFCDIHDCRRDCPLFKSDSCQLAWAQMPYEKGGANGR